MINPLFYFIFAFFLGSIPTAFWAGKILKGMDIREFGSGNVGATNAFRVLGKGIGSFVFIFDFLKGVTPIYLFSYMNPAAQSISPLLVGLAAILGHVFTPFLGFRGGKGIATGAGVLLASYPVFFLIAIAVWIAAFKLTKIVSLSSLLAVVALLISAIFGSPDNKVRLFFLGMTLFVFWTHRSNIIRLKKGEERPIVNKQKSK